VWYTDAIAVWGRTTHFREAVECRATFAPSCMLYSYVEGRDSVTDKQYPEGSTTFIIDHEFINMSDTNTHSF